MRNRNTRLDDVLTTAMDAFWECVAREFREVKSGDLPPEADIPFNEACRNVVTAWLDINTPATTATATATCELVVHMRPPRKGERMYMVNARTAKEALAEIRRESEELGYIADSDRTDEPDENGMIAVTIEIRNSGMDPLDNRDAQERDSLTAAAEGKWQEFALTLRECEGWKATWMYPGYLAWNRDGAPFFICASPDFNRPGMIDVQTQDDEGNVWDEQLWMQNEIPWERGKRSSTTYVAAMRDTLTKANAYIRNRNLPVESAQRATLVAVSKPGALTSLSLANYQVGEIVDQLYRYEHESPMTAIPHDKIVAAIRGESFDDHEGLCALSQPALKPLTDYYLAMTGKLAKEAK